MTRLRSLSEHSDIRFGEESYDVRNWSVRTATDNSEVGTVHDVLLDEDGRTRYLDIDVGGRHVLMPSGNTRVDPTDEVVHVPGLSREGMGTLPEYDQEPSSITPEYSRSLNTAYDEAYSSEHYYDRADYATGWGGRSGETAGAEGRTGSGTLARLDELDDIEVASHDPDPRGWQVVDSDGHRVGRVDHVIGDTAAMKARYLTVEVDDDLATDRHVLVPVGHVDLDTDNQRVLSRALHRDRIADVPAYEGGSIDRDYENRLRHHYDRLYTGGNSFDHPRYRSRTLNARGA